MEADDAVNYGAIGAVIGHELTHGFDDQGRKYNGDGNLTDWWTESDGMEFDTRATVMVEQYDRYSPIDTMRVNGRLTLGENIADLGGLTIAYYAYKKSLGDAKAPVLDGLTGEQRFFLGWAQVWGRKYRDDELRNRLVTDSHSPSMFRTNGVEPDHENSMPAVPTACRSFSIQGRECSRKYFMAPWPRDQISSSIRRGSRSSVRDATRLSPTAARAMLYKLNRSVVIYATARRWFFM